MTGPSIKFAFFWFNVYGIVYSSFFSFNAKLNQERILPFREISQPAVS